MSVPWSVTCAVAATVLALPSPQQLWAQDAPAPLPPRAFNPPEITLERIRGGARLIVVENSEVPLVTVDLILPGGQATDPDGQEGTALVAASLLKAGTSSRSWTEITEGLDRVGASLTATADADWTRVSLVTLPEVLEAALEIMADVVVEPAFPEARVETVRRQALGALAAQRSQPGALARRVMLREVYRGHPYGKQTTEETIAAIDREGLMAHHARWYRPGSALVVVAGAVSPADARRSVERAFADWGGGTAPEMDFGPVRRSDGGIVLVHTPGSVQAEIRVGHTLPPGGAAGWTALEVAAHHLGATPSGRLARELREQRGFTYSAGATAERRLAAGVLDVGFAARNEVAVEALGEALRIVDEVVTRPMSETDRRAAVEFLAGSFPLQNETPQQVAGRASARTLLGLEPEPPGEVLARLRALTAGGIRGALSDAVDPGRVEIVVVGDATVLQPGLAIYGDVRIERPDGTPISLADLLPTERSTSLTATGLEAGVWRYEISLQGQPVGSLVREISIAGDTRTASSTLQLGPRTTVQSVTFGAEGFDFQESAIDITQPGVRVEGDVRLQGDRIVGYLDFGPGREPVDIRVPAGVLVSDMLELAVWIAELEVGGEIALPVASVSSAAVANASLRVVERTEVTVPAGTFEVFRVEIDGPERQTIWARVEAPHIVVRAEPADQPIVIELAEIGPAPPGGP